MNAADGSTVEFCINGAQTRAWLEIGSPEQHKFPTTSDYAIAAAVIRRSRLPEATNPGSIDLAEVNDRRGTDKSFVLAVIGDAIADTKNQSP